MVSLKKGEKVDLTKNNPGLTKIMVGLGWQSNMKNSMEIDLDASVFLLGANNKCYRDDDVIFYGNPKSRQEAIIHSGDNRVGAVDAEQIRVDLTKMPSDVERISFTITIHEAEQRKQNFEHITDGYVRVVDQTNNNELFRFDLGKEISQETAIIVCEIYHHKGEWKFVAVGSGYFGGLAALCKSFGLEVEDEKKTVSLPPPIQQPSKLSIMLSKKQSVSLSKRGLLTATLKWEKTGDLDLYCFYVTMQGDIGKVYYNNMGNANRYPNIVLKGDSLIPGTEVIEVHKPEVLKYVLIAAYSAVGNGTGSFKSYKPTAIITDTADNKVTVPLYDKNSYSYWVAIAHIDFTQIDSMKISQVEKYSGVCVEKSPVIYEDGKFKMDIGPIEFKT